MAADTYTVSLSSGEEWVLNTRPKWGVLRKMQATEDTNEQLALFTVSWTFKDTEGEPVPVSAEAIDEFDIEDVISTFEAFNSEVLPFFEGLTKTLSANSPSKSSPATPPEDGQTSASGAGTSEN